METVHARANGNEAKAQERDFFIGRVVSMRAKAKHRYGCFLLLATPSQLDLQPPISRLFSGTHQSDSQSHKQVTRSGPGSVGGASLTFPKMANFRGSLAFPWQPLLQGGAPEVD